MHVTNKYQHLNKYFCIEFYALAKFKYIELINLDLVLLPLYQIIAA